MVDAAALTEEYRFAQEMFGAYRGKVYALRVISAYGACLLTGIPAEPPALDMQCLDEALELLYLQCEKAVDEANSLPGKMENADPNRCEFIAGLIMDYIGKRLAAQEGFRALGITAVVNDSIEAYRPHAELIFKYLKRNYSKEEFAFLKLLAGPNTVWFLEHIDG